jgi:CheY-like chemotaxis protein
MLGNWMFSYSVYSNLEEEVLVRHHHYIACKDYDKTITKKINSLRNLDFSSQLIQQDQLEHVDKKSPKSKRIMLVEDEDDIILLFKMILESDVGLKVDSFTDPFSALNNFGFGQYDLIMIDIALPRMNGIELYYKIRKLDNKVKICFLTAGEMYYEEVRKQVFPELEANCIIRKPITNEDLIQKVKDILKIQ